MGQILFYEDLLHRYSPDPHPALELAIRWLKRNAPPSEHLSLVHGDALLFSAEAAKGTQNLVTGLLAILLTAIAVAGLAYKSRRKLLRRFGFDSILIFVVYVGGMVLLMIEGR